jgi:nitrite reductase/ring-hydroxylating ferredoxin subunit
VGGVVSCPWHQWTFELDTGVCTHSPLARVRRYEAELREGVIWVEIE